ncbi:hypothetical protein COLO4_15454 [Corchorus olitorius]|uniref:Uncharacterized protein n=1 Tax=Corchorus olitorius TaxID=93759 RepID=A0A1R3JMR4_9ROSI|nr:hypothetical protein COLO4_15454 [Corchorus olitorius]
MKATLILVVTLFLLGIIDGIGPKLCYGRDIPLKFHQMHHEIERMALEAVQRLKSTRFPSRNIYPPPAVNLRNVQQPEPKVPWLLPAPIGQLTPPPPPPPPPPQTFRYCSTCNERRGNRGGYPKMDP